ncbi:hypothetical protein LCGC14_1163310 [marine sediment metagenome]|uniref:Uncharacterized protein n=1 Tax=marine sediment metagenome TaxID=412755 RepID=A0A0F9PXL0_9ZZZZ
MDLERQMAKQVDLLQFKKLPKKKAKNRKEPQNFILDYILVGSIVMFSVLLVIYFALVILI